MDKLTRIINVDLVRKFLEEHRDLYDEFEREGILSYLRYGKYPEIFHKEIVREVLEKLGLIPDTENINIEFLNQIERVHNLDGKNIIEVGSGVFPHLAERISIKQNSGTVTVYDPRLDPREKSADRLILKREDFTRKTPVDGADLLIGLMPCKGAEYLIDQAVKNNIDFFVWLCEGGPHGDIYDYFEDEDEWMSCVKVCASRGVEDNRMGEYKQKILTKYSETFPIIYNIRH